jgi:hypothetical protein
MRKPFFITGYPRSRTAWLANLLTYKNTFCWHEALLRFRGPTAFQRAAAKRPEVHVGTADSSLGTCAEALLRLYPKAPWVLIVRDRSEVIESLKGTPVPAILGESLEDVLDQFMVALQPVADHSNTMIVGYHALEEEAVVREIMAHCAPSVPWDRERWLMLDRLRVELHDRKALEALKL